MKKIIGEIKLVIDHLYLITVREFYDIQISLSMGIILVTKHDRLANKNNILMYKSRYNIYIPLVDLFIYHNNTVCIKSEHCLI